MKICFVIITLFCIINDATYAQVVVDIDIREGESISMNYYKPFKGIANEELPTAYGVNITGKISLSFELNEPTFIKLVINDKIVELLCEPNDTLSLSVKDPLIHKNDWLEVKGPNSTGHNYYNMVFNKFRFDKYFKIREVFEQNYDKDPGFLISKISHEINNQVVWVDSLFLLKRISQPFRDLMKTQISSTLAWEVGEQCNKYFEMRDSMSFTSSAIKRKLFEIYNPLDVKLKRTLAKSYYYTYFHELYKRQTKSDTSNIIVYDAPFYSIAPPDLQEYLWGTSLFAHYKYAPHTDRNCRMFKNYASRFSNSPYTEYLNKSDICQKVETKESSSKIINTIDSDIFTFLQFNFFGKRVLIDLWATWCVPCKVEFKNYDSSFYQFLKDQKIELVFISIDKPEQKDRWEREVGTLNLKGHHILAKAKLKSSIESVVYDDGAILIPRYIVADENGRILSTDFKRPSDNSFRKEILTIFK